MCSDCEGKGEWDDGTAHIRCCWCDGMGKIKPLGYSQTEDQVILTMTREDYNSILFALGYATGASSDLPDRKNALIELMNRLNQGNPNYTPYATTTT